MLHKTFDLLETKADGDSGEFTAIVSTFGNVDRVGDRIMPGAWTKTLAEWSQSGDPIPIILAHQWEDPMAHIGIARPEDVKQVAQGLQVTGKLDVEDNPVAKQVYKLMKRRSLKEFSIGYDVPEGGEKRAKDGANEISEITLAECGPCLKGVDPKTELQEVKSALHTQVLPGAEQQRKEASRVQRESEEERLPAVPASESEPEPVKPETFIDTAELNGAQTGLLKAVWTAAYINDLPDGAFLHIESGGTKDSDGKTTPRSLRHFPYKDADGNIDLPHLRNALARIPQSNLPASVKEELTRKAQRILDSQKASDRDAMDRKAKRVAREAEEERLPHVPDPEPAPQVNLETELQEVKTLLAEMREGLEDLKKKAERTAKEPRARAVDPLREQAEAVALEEASGGESLRKPPRKVTTKPPELLPLEELKQRTRDEILVHLSGDIT